MGWRALHRRIRGTLPGIERHAPDLPWLAGLAAAAVLAGLLVWPAGEFPLNDDWSYARFVQSILAGEPRFTGWTSMPLVAQGLWGALFCLPFGFSFHALRISTAAAGLLGAWGVYSLGRSVGRGRPTAFVAALALALNPIYLNLSWTFMTDVPFLAVAVWALVGFVRAFSNGRFRWIAMGALAGSAAALIRHPGVVLPLAFLPASRIGGREFSLARAGGPAVLAVSALAGFCAYAAAQWGLDPFWIRQGGDLMAGVGTPAGWIRILERCGEMAIYFGLFGFPYELWRLAGESGRRAVSRLAWTLPPAGLAGIGLAAMGLRLPFAGNVLHVGGVGPVRLIDVAANGAAQAQGAESVAWILATILGLAGFLLGVWRWFATWRHASTGPADNRRTLALFALCAAGWALPMLAAGYLDRYLLVLLPLWLLDPAPPRSDSASRPVPALRIAAVVALVSMGAFSVAATHDYFSWNRARWAALADGMEFHNAAPGRIDGGFEFNGWYNFDPRHPADRGPVVGRSWWWVADDEFAVALRPVAGYRELARYPYSRWLGASPGEVLWLRRNELAPGR